MSSYLNFLDIKEEFSEEEWSKIVSMLSLVLVFSGGATILNGIVNYYFVVALDKEDIYLYHSENNADRVDSVEVTHFIGK